MYEIAVRRRRRWYSEVGLDGEMGSSGMVVSVVAEAPDADESDVVVLICESAVSDIVDSDNGVSF